MWHHLLLAMPVLGLGLFLMLPWQESLPGYLLMLGFSFLVYRKALKAMRLPVVTGLEGVIGQRGFVVAKDDAFFTPYLVSVSGELWRAEGGQELVQGEEVTVVGLQGNRVLVRRVEDGRDGAPGGS